MLFIKNPIELQHSRCFGGFIGALREAPIHRLFSSVYVWSDHDITFDFRSLTVTTELIQIRYQARELKWLSLSFVRRRWKKKLASGKKLFNVSDWSIVCVSIPRSYFLVYQCFTVAKGLFVFVPDFRLFCGLSFSFWSVRFCGLVFLLFFLFSVLWPFHPFSFLNLSPCLCCLSFLYEPFPCPVGFIARWSIFDKGFIFFLFQIANFAYGREVVDTAWLEPKGVCW